MNQAPTAIIADDEIHLANFLKQRLSVLWPELNILGMAKNGIEALWQIASYQPNVIFLDIQMPGLSGMEVAKLLPQPAGLVFVTAYEHYALDAFDQDAIDYLLKPVTDERLSRTIARVKAKFKERQQVALTPPNITGSLSNPVFKTATSETSGQYLRWIRAMAGETVRQIPVADVYYLQARDKYVCVYTKDGESLIRSSLTELGAQLDPNEFWVIYRSIIVNINRVISIHRDTMSHMQLGLKDTDIRLPVSRGYEHLFKQM